MTRDVVPRPLVVAWTQTAHDSAPELLGEVPPGTAAEDVFQPCECDGDPCYCEHIQGEVQVGSLDVFIQAAIDADLAGRRLS